MSPTEPRSDWKPCDNHLWELKLRQGVLGMSNQFWQCARRGCGVMVGTEAGER